MLPPDSDFQDRISSRTAARRIPESHPLVLLAPYSSARHKPLALKPGSTIGIAAPASLPLDLDAIDRGIRTLEARGYHVKRVRQQFKRNGYLAGSDEERISEFNALLRDDDVDAIIAVRGGYGTLRLLPHLDYEAATRHPKLLVGYSDITALQLALLTKAGVPSLSGPMVAVEWGDPDAPSEDLFWALMRGDGLGEFAHPSAEPLIPLRNGNAEGTLIGGNLSLISRLVGTPYLPDLTGAILFLEEVGEEPYRIDGLLAHLQLSGVLDRIAGLVIGGFTDSEPDHDRPTLSMDDVIAHYAINLGIPVATGLSYGHFPVKYTMPIGVKASLTVESGRASLSLLEAAVQTGS
jgi:muramoyltetrapeptide carboxypeptidase